MNTWKKKPVTLIVADSGPLISLSLADRLELLQTFGRPVLIVDTVQMECTKKAHAPGRERLADWLNTTGKNQFELIKTPFASLYEDALTLEMSGEDKRATQGLGDATISWLVKNLDRTAGRDGKTPVGSNNDIVLILTEDGPFGDGHVSNKREAHILSTREWLAALENLKIIASADQILKEIEAAGRTVSKYRADRPAIIDPNVQVRSDGDLEGGDIAVAVMRVGHEKLLIIT